MSRNTCKNVISSCYGYSFLCQKVIGLKFIQAVQIMHIDNSLNIVIANFTNHLHNIYNQTKLHLKQNQCDSPHKSQEANYEFFALVTIL